MDNWLLIIVGVIFLISIVAGYVRGLLKIGISLLATVLSIVLVMFLAPYVSDALIKWTPADEMIEEKCMEMFMPQISADTLKNADLSGTSLGELNQDQLADINNLDWNQLGINIQDILNIIGEIPKEVQIQEIENAALPEFLNKTCNSSHRLKRRETSCRIRLKSSNFPTILRRTRLWPMATSIWSATSTSRSWIISISRMALI